MLQWNTGFSEMKWPTAQLSASPRSTQPVNDWRNHGLYPLHKCMCVFLCKKQIYSKLTLRTSNIVVPEALHVFHRQTFRFSNTARFLWARQHSSHGRIKRRALRVRRGNCYKSINDRWLLTDVTEAPSELERNHATNTKVEAIFLNGLQRRPIQRK